MAQSEKEELKLVVQEMKIKEQERGFRKENVVKAKALGVTPVEVAGAERQEGGRSGEYAGAAPARAKDKGGKRVQEASQEGAAASGDAKLDKFNELFEHINDLQDEIKLKDETIQEFTAMFERLNADSDQWQQQITQ